VFFFSEKTTEIQFSSAVFMVKVTIQLASLILAVKHNLCYWMSNKPRKISHVSKLQQTPKFTDNQRTIDTDICIFVHIWVYSFHMRYTRFGAYPNRIHITIIIKTDLLKKLKQNKRKFNNTDRD
jgi:hypothetical protein